MIKIEVKRAPATATPSEYPKLVWYSNTGSVVLLTEQNTGTLLKNGTSSRHLVGYTTDDWSENNQEPFRGTISLEG